MIFWVSLFFLPHPAQGGPTQGPYGKVKNEKNRPYVKFLSRVLISSGANSFKIGTYAKN